MAERPAAAVDFARLILQLHTRTDLTRKDICRLAKIPRTSLFNYENGTTPQHHVGEALIRVWCEALGRPRDAVPRIRALLDQPTKRPPREQAASVSGVSALAAQFARVAW